MTTNLEECGPCPVFCKFYPGICLTTEEKGRKNLSQDEKKLSQGTLYILPKHPHITKPTHTYTHTHTHTQTPMYYTRPHNAVNLTVDCGPVNKVAEAKCWAKK